MQDKPRLLEMTESGQTFLDRIKHPLMFKAYMLVKMPVLGVTGSYLADVDLEGAVGVLPDNWRTRNLFGRTSNAAIYAAAETVSTAMMVLHLRNIGSSLDAVITDVDIHIGTLGTSPLRIIDNNGLDYAQFIEETERTDADSASGAFDLELEATETDWAGSIEIWWELSR